MEAIETMRINGYRVEIHQDEDTSDPRKDFDHLGIMVDWHRRYDLGDRKIEENERQALRRGGWRLLERYLRRTIGARNVISLGLLDHSGLHIYADGGSHWSDSQGWDSGSVGFIYTTAEKIAEAGIAEENIDRALRSEVEEYDQYLSGDVYGYVIETPDGAHQDSCWGFYGFDYCKEEAESTAKGLKPMARRLVHLRPNATLQAYTHR